MSAIASDSARSYREAVAEIAKEASPRGSEIDVRENAAGIALHIDFDMSSMTSGEHGSRTKHHTVESLRKEVNVLIARVANDVFQFCRAFEVESIHVGCRHHVRTHYGYGQTREENMVLYRVLIHKDRIPTLEHNPFLDVYSTTEYMQVAEDNFAKIEITTVRM